MDFRWTTENVFRLIKMYEDRELLWNTSLEDYKNRDKKRDAWCKIANAFKVDPSVIHRKIKSLLTQFQREIKKAKYDAERNEISNWFAFDQLLFLKKRNLQTKKISYNCRRDVTEKVQTKNVIKSRTSVRMLLSNNKKNKTQKGKLKRLKPKQQNLVVTPKTKTQKKKVRPQDEPQEVKTVDNRTLDILQQMHESRQERDEFDVFGEHVAIKLRQLNSSCANHTAQYHIHNILYNAAMGEYDVPSNRNSYHEPPNNSRGYRSGCPRPGSPAVSQSSVITAGPSRVLHASVDDETSTEYLEDILDEIKEEVC